MKKFFRFFACGFFALAVMTSCHCHHFVAMAAEKPETFRIVASTFPVWLFTRNICVDAENVRLDLLVPASAGCPHDFAPKPQDMQKLNRADALIINGHDLEEFLQKPLKNLERHPWIIDAGGGVPLLYDKNGAPNPHIFAAPREAAIMAANIAKGLSQLDKPNAEIYAANAKTYIERLDALSKKLMEIGAKAKNKKIALQHDALAYLAANCGLDVAAMLQAQASAAQLAAVAKQLSLEKPALLAGDIQYSDTLLKLLAKETGLPFAMLSPCATGPENAAIDYYEAVMEKNYGILEKYFD